MASGSPASVCTMTGRAVAALGHFGNSRDPGDRRFDDLSPPRLRRRAARRASACGCRTPPERSPADCSSARRCSASSHGSGSSYSAIVTSSRNLNRIAVPIRASEICETVLADRIRIRTGTSPCFRASAAKFAGADLRIPRILRPEPRSSASPHAACASDCRN